jgi:hypothetical protein
VAEEFRRRDLAKLEGIFEIILAEFIGFLPADDRLF